MKVFEKLLNNVIRVQAELPVIISGLAVKHSAEIIDLNVEQLSKGLTNKGEFISPVLQSDEYSQGKKSKGGKAPFGVPDMINEGDFTSGFYIEQKGDQFLIDSRDPKSSELESKYDGIFGLTNDSKGKLIELMDPELSKIIANELTK